LCMHGVVEEGPQHVACFSFADRGDRGSWMPQ
jgi:hypothetical protein